MKTIKQLYHLKGRVHCHHRDDFVFVNRRFCRMVDEVLWPTARHKLSMSRNIAMGWLGKILIGWVLGQWTKQLNPDVWRDSQIKQSFANTDSDGQYHTGQPMLALVSPQRNHSIIQYRRQSINNYHNEHTGQQISARFRLQPLLFYIYVPFVLTKCDHSNCFQFCFWI